MVLNNPKTYEEGKTIVFLVRHGDRLETDNNSRIPGPGLSPKGKLQAKRAAKEFKKLIGQVDVLITSGMTRAQETAREINTVLKKKIIVYDELSEFNKFVWQRKLYHPKFWKHYYKYVSAQNTFDNILKKYSGKVIVLVIHGNVIKGIIGKKMKINFERRGLMDHNNCNITKARFVGTKIDYLYYFNSRTLF